MSPEFGAVGLIRTQMIASRSSAGQPSGFAVAENQVLEGRVVGVTGNLTTIQVGAQRVTAEAETPLQPGDMLRLLVREVAGDRVVLQIIPRPEASGRPAPGADAPLHRALEGLRLPPKADNLAIARELVAQGLPLTRENVVDVRAGLLRALRGGTAAPARGGVGAPSAPMAAPDAPPEAVGSGDDATSSPLNAAGRPGTSRGTPTGASSTPEPGRTPSGPASAVGAPRDPAPGASAAAPGTATPSAGEPDSAPGSTSGPSGDAGRIGSSAPPATPGGPAGTGGRTPTSSLASDDAPDEPDATLAGPISARPGAPDGAGAPTAAPRPPGPGSTPATAGGTTEVANAFDPPDVRAAVFLRAHGIAIGPGALEIARDGLEHATTQARLVEQAATSLDRLAAAPTNGLPTEIADLVDELTALRARLPALHGGQIVAARAELANHLQAVIEEHGTLLEAKLARLADAGDPGARALADDVARGDLRARIAELGARADEALRSAAALPRELAEALAGARDALQQVARGLEFQQLANAAPSSPRADQAYVFHVPLPGAPGQSAELRIFRPPGREGEKLDISHIHVVFRFELRHLKTVQVSLNVVNQRVHCNIGCSDPSVAGFVRQNSDGLRQGLNALGFSVDEVATGELAPDVLDAATAAPTRSTRLARLDARA